MALIAFRPSPTIFVGSAWGAQKSPAPPVAEMAMIQPQQFAVIRTVQGTAVPPVTEFDSTFFSGGVDFC